MKLLANENCPAALVRALRDRGHDVAWIWEDARGCADRDVLARAQREQRVLATFDKDFGELAVRSRMPADCGILLLRLTGTPEQVVELGLAAIEGRSDWSGHFAVVTNDRIRMRKMHS